MWKFCLNDVIGLSIRAVFVCQLIWRKAFIKGQELLNSMFRQSTYIGYSCVIYLATV
mgnify:FL=1